MYGTAVSFSQFRSGNYWKTISVALLLCIISIQPGLAQEQGKLLRTLSVSGRGVAKIPTTLSQVSLSVEVQSKTAQSAQEEAARRSSAVVALLKTRNVEKLQTTGISLNPVYSYNNNAQRITGYAANNTVSFRIYTDKVGNVLDEAVRVGATGINGVSFVASDEAIASAQQQALRQATLDAQQQANAIFSTLGFKAKEVLSIQVNAASASPLPVMFQRVEAAKLASADYSTPVIGGEQQVEASVTLQIGY